MIDYLVIFLIILGIWLILYVVHWVFTTDMFDAIYLFRDWPPPEADEALWIKGHKEWQESAEDVEP